MSDFGFKFAIGDIVTHVVTQAIGKADRFLIIERLLQECPGGIQRHYKARAVNRIGGIGEPAILFNEIEVCKSAPFTKEDFGAYWKDAIAELAS